MRVFRLSKLLPAAIATLTTGALAYAQTAPRAFARITAHDSSGVPVSGAELTLTRGLHDVVARGMTDGEGRAMLALEPKDSTDFQVTIRKVGYARGDRFFVVGPRDTATV